MQSIENSPVLRMRPSECGAPLPIIKSFIEEGRDHLFSGEVFGPGRPIIVLQGLLDRDIPAGHIRRTRDVLKSDCLELIVGHNGDHRMSRPRGLELLSKVVKKVI